MAHFIRNNTQLKSLLLPVIRKSIKNSGEKLNKEIVDKIQTIVYDVYKPKFYQRREFFYEGEIGFIGSWSHKESYTANGMKTTIASWYNKMHHDPKEFVHGSPPPLWETDDVRDRLDELIFEGHSGDLFGWGKWTQKRNAWDPFIKYVNDDFLKSEIINIFKKNDLKITKI